MRVVNDDLIEADRGATKWIDTLSDLRVVCEDPATRDIVETGQSPQNSKDRTRQEEIKPK